MLDVGLGVGVVQIVRPILRPCVALLAEVRSLQRRLVGDVRPPGLGPIFRSDFRLDFGGPLFFGLGLRLPVGLIFRLHPFRLEAGQRFGPLCLFGTLLSGTLLFSACGRGLRPRLRQLLALVGEHFGGAASGFATHDYAPSHRPQRIPPERAHGKGDDGKPQNEQTPDDPHEIDERAADVRAQPPPGFLGPIQ